MNVRADALGREVGDNFGQVERGRLRRPGAGARGQESGEEGGRQCGEKAPASA
jgi:hypothetical protein